MGWFDEPKRKRTPRQVLASLEAKMRKKKRALDKKKAKATTRNRIEAARKKLRGY